MTAFDLITRVSNETYSPYYEVTSAYHGARVGRSWTPDDQDMTLTQLPSLLSGESLVALVLFSKDRVCVNVGLFRQGLPDEVS